MVMEASLLEPFKAVLVTRKVCSRVLDILLIMATIRIILVARQPAVATSKRTTEATVDAISNTKTRTTVSTPKAAMAGSRNMEWDTSKTFAVDTVACKILMVRSSHSNSSRRRINKEVEMTINEDEREVVEEVARFLNTSSSKAHLHSSGNSSHLEFKARAGVPQTSQAGGRTNRPAAPVADGTLVDLAGRASRASTYL
jgi:hypothetical protein